MNMNIQKDYTIDYDPEILSKIKELIKEGFEKLKSFVKSQKRFKVYHELEEKFNNIANNLRHVKSFSKEFTYYRFVKGKILHIVYKNCENASYGHCDFALELFNFFIDVWKAKIRLYENYSKEELALYEKKQENFKKRKQMYRRKFYCDIYEFSGEFDEDKMYNIHASLMTES